MRLCCIVVLYNKKVDDSSTLAFFIQHLNVDVKVCVFDNSNKEYNNREACIRRGWYYLSLGENKGISTAYNNAVEYVLKKDKKIDYLMMLDDDAHLNTRYFEYLKRNIPSQIGVPIIKSGNKILSPAKVTVFGRIKAVDGLQELNAKNITAINNGMVISRKVFQKIKYNEEIFVDYVDHDFMRQAKQKEIDIQVIPYTLTHEMSIVDEEVPENKRLSRFKIYSKDLKKYFSRDVSEKIFVRAHLLIKGIEYFNHYHNFDFIKIVFKK